MSLPTWSHIPFGGLSPGGGVFVQRGLPPGEGASLSNGGSPPRGKPMWTDKHCENIPSLVVGNYSRSQKYNFRSSDILNYK